MFWITIILCVWWFLGITGVILLVKNDFYRFKKTYGYEDDCLTPKQCCIASLLTLLGLIVFWVSMDHVLEEGGLFGEHKFLKWWNKPICKRRPQK